MFGLALMSKLEKRDTGIDPQTPITDARYVVMDTELTGLDVRKDSIVSLGAIAMTGGRILMGETLYEEVCPGAAMRSESVVVHCITPSDVAGKPSIGAVLEDFLGFCAGAIVVGHFLSLDQAILNKELKNITGRIFDLPVVDTLRLHEWIKENSGDFSRHYSGNARDKDLFSLAQKYQIPVSGAHNALMDAFITAQLFQRFLRLLPELGVMTVKELLKIGKP